MYPVKELPTPTLVPAGGVPAVADIADVVDIRPPTPPPGRSVKPFPCLGSKSRLTLLNSRWWPHSCRTLSQRSKAGSAP